jgi:hypothetical protein
VRADRNPWLALELSPEEKYVELIRAEKYVEFNRDEKYVPPLNIVINLPSKINCKVS